MPLYDTTFILNPQLEESGLDGRIQEYIDLIGGNGGKLVKESRIGMRRLAYEIANLNQGYYVSLVFDGSPELVNELERRLRLDEGCLRFLTCRYQDFSVRRKDAKKKKIKEYPSESAEPRVQEQPTEAPRAGAPGTEAEPESEASSEEML
jgi:small subunit ribosomal protein S6